MESCNHSYTRSGFKHHHVAKNFSDTLDAKSKEPYHAKSCDVSPCSKSLFEAHLTQLSLVHNHGVAVYVCEPSSKPQLLTGVPYYAYRETSMPKRYDVEIGSLHSVYNKQIFKHSVLLMESSQNSDMTYNSSPQHLYNIQDKNSANSYYVGFIPRSRNNYLDYLDSSEILYSDKQLQEAPRRYLSSQHFSAYPPHYTRSKTISNGRKSFDHFSIGNMSSEKPSNLSNKSVDNFHPLGNHLMTETFSKINYFKRYLKNKMESFFGICNEIEEESVRNKWRERRKRMASKRYSDLKETFEENFEEYGINFKYLSNLDGTQISNKEKILPMPLPHNIKSSVLSLAINGLKTTFEMLTQRKLRKPKDNYELSRSYKIFAFPDDFDAKSYFLPPPVPYHSDLFSKELFFDKPLKLIDISHMSHLPLIKLKDEVHNDVRNKRFVNKWQRQCPSEGAKDESTYMTRISPRLLEKACDNSNRAELEKDVLSRLFRHQLHFSSKKHVDQKELDDINDHRPFFTYWITTVQIFIMIIALICYGFGPVGFEVLVTSLSLQQVDYWEPSSVWLGTRASDLIHLGAKFAPCMRKDAKLYDEINSARRKEKGTACCIRNDNSGCVQASEAECSAQGLTDRDTLSTWHKWHAESRSPGGRISGSVCGLDPDFCQEPASVAPYIWPDDITQWPVCRKRRFESGLAAKHMICEVIGHPCCIGIHGECRITTREYCEFVRGHFHEDASLCSQVSCLHDVCGMIPFYYPDVPDQIYRLWTSLFLHAGIIHLLITILIQYFLMRDLEKLAGCFRIAIIYLLSGIAGNLTSAIFISYRADVGPSGSQFGLLACLFVEVIHVWPILKNPIRALLKLCCITFFLFLMGLFPWVDNYAHIGGFLVGFLLAYALFPFSSLGPYNRRRKVILIYVCLIAVFLIFLLLFLLFYVIPFYECRLCEYLDCLPLTRDFCGEQNIHFNRRIDLI